MAFYFITQPRKWKAASGIHLPISSCPAFNLSLLEGRRQCVGPTVHPQDLSISDQDNGLAQIKSDLGCDFGILVGVVVEN